jgi:hypothetical protein
MQVVNIINTFIFVVSIPLCYIRFRSYTLSNTTHWMLIHFNTYFIIPATCFGYVIAIIRPTRTVVLALDAARSGMKHLLFASIIKFFKNCDKILVSDELWNTIKSDTDHIIYCYVMYGAVVAGVGVHWWKILVPDKLQSTMKSHTFPVMLCGAVVVDVWCVWVYTSTTIAPHSIMWTVCDFIVLCSLSGTKIFHQCTPTPATTAPHNT